MGKSGIMLAGIAGAFLGSALSLWYGFSADVSIVIGAAIGFCLGVTISAHVWAKRHGYTRNPVRLLFFGSLCVGLPPVAWFMPETVGTPISGLENPYILYAFFLAITVCGWGLAWALLSRGIHGLNDPAQTPEEVKLAADERAHEQGLL